MSESVFPTDLLSSLASNPDLLKNAMQMASALASSGVLDGFLGKGGGEGSRQSPSPSGTGDFSTLLAGLSGNNPPPHQSDTGHPSPQPSRSPKPSDEASPPRKRPNPPCHNDRVQLLKSLRPFLPEDKREKIDFLVQLLGLLHTAEELGLRKLF